MHKRLRRRSARARARWPSYRAVNGGDCGGRRGGEEEKEQKAFLNPATLYMVPKEMTSMARHVATTCAEGQSTVKLVITHTSWFRLPAMGFYRVWVVRVGAYPMPGAKGDPNEFTAVARSDIPCTSLRYH